MVIGSWIQNISVLGLLTLVARCEGFVGSISFHAIPAAVNDLACSMWHVAGQEGTSGSESATSTVGGMLPDGSIDYVRTQGLVEGSDYNTVLA